MLIGGVLTRIVDSHVHQAALVGAAEQRRVQRALEVRREDREHVDAHRGLLRGAVDVEEPVGQVDDEDTWFLLDDEDERHERAVVEDEDVVRRVRLDRGDATERLPVQVAHLVDRCLPDADQFVVGPAIEAAECAVAEQAACVPGA